MNDRVLFLLAENDHADEGQTERGRSVEGQPERGQSDDSQPIIPEQGKQFELAVMVKLGCIKVWMCENTRLPSFL